MGPADQWGAPLTALLTVGRRRTAISLATSERRLRLTFPKRRAGACKKGATHYRFGFDCVSEFR